jgi:hypothetical protein
MPVLLMEVLQMVVLQMVVGPMSELHLVQALSLKVDL